MKPGVTTLIIPLSGSMVEVDHRRKTTKDRRGNTVQPSTKDIMGSVCCWSQDIEMMKKSLSKLPEVVDVRVLPKEKA